MITWTLPKIPERRRPNGTQSPRKEAKPLEKIHQRIHRWTAGIAILKNFVTRNCRLEGLSIRSKIWNTQPNDRTNVRSNSPEGITILKKITRSEISDLKATTGAYIVRRSSGRVHRWISKGDMGAVESLVSSTRSLALLCYVMVITWTLPNRYKNVEDHRYTKPTKRSQT